MNQRNLLAILTLALLQTACGGGGSDGSGSIPTTSNSSIIGTVPGTLIEAFGDNGSYYVVASDDDGTDRHPFELTVPPGMGVRLVMTTGEGTGGDEVVTPIGFRDNKGNLRTRLVLGTGDVVDLGHIPVETSITQFDLS